MTSIPYFEEATMLTIRLPKSVEERLNTLSSETEHTKSFFVKEVLIRYLEELEDVYLSSQVLERIRENKEKVYLSDELEELFTLEK